jgi:hypothetical protein
VKMATITPKNWAEFQHYKDRKPSWIKLHRDILDNFDYHCLPLASKALAPCLWLLASEYDGGHVPADWRLIAFRLRMTEQEVIDAVTPLISSGFFVASEPLADCKQDACLEKEKEKEKEREKEKHSSSASPDDPSTSGANGNVVSLTSRDGIPYTEFVSVFNEVCGDTFPQVVKLTDKRRKRIRTLWKTNTSDSAKDSARTDSLDYWRRYFAHCLTIGFFTAERNGTGHDGWRPDFDFLTSEKGYIGVLEGKYV